MKIKGYLSTVRPIHIASNTSGNETGIATSGVLNRTTGFVDRVPVVPGTVFRAKLRRAASDYVNARLRETGTRIPLEVFNALRHGSNSGRQTNDAVRASFFTAQREHPLMGMFGGGPRQSSNGGLHIPNLYPFCQETVAIKMVPELPEEQAKAPYARNLVDEQTMYPGLDIIKDHDESCRDIIEDFDAKIDEILAADVARRTKSGEDEGAPVSTLRGSNLLVFKSLVAGTLVYLDLSVDPRTSDIQKGFLIICLQTLLNTNKIGGMARIGIGLDVFDLAYAAYSIELDRQRLFDLNDTQDQLVVRPGSKAADYVSAFLAWEDDGKAWTAESLMKATGFEGIDLTQAAVKKQKPKTAAKPKPKAA